MDLIPLVGVAVVAFASTNIDDIFVLLGFYSDPKFRVRDIVVGQYLGIAALFGVSVILSLVSLVIPADTIRLLGLAPVLIGGKQLFDLWRGREASEAELETHPGSGTRFPAITVAAVAIANGGDNIGIYTPLFAARPSWQLIVIGLVFAAMTAAWCVVGHWMVKHPTLGAPIRRHGHRVVPLVLIGLGAMILAQH